MAQTTMEARTLIIALFCYKNGEFIDKISMQEYIEKCVPFASQANMTEDEMRKHLETTLPTLKRWK